nr:sugar phosphate isomerase/epimerase [Lewinella cohaerens]
MQRRKFLQTTSYLAVGTLLPAKAVGCSKKESLENIGLQLYTIRDAMQRDDNETLRRVAAIGYDYVEGAGYRDGKLYGHSPQTFLAMLKNYGLQMPSGHVSWEAMKEAPEKAAATCKEAGQSFLVIPWWPEDKRNAEGYAELIDILNTSGEVCKRYGLQLAYHNHDFEFNKMVAGSRPINLLLAEVDPDLVQFEMDLYWVTRAGSDYQEYFRKHAGRFPLWHVKDMDNTPEKFFAAVGEGVIDWPAIFSKEQQAGMQYFFVEQDRTVPGKDPFDEITISHKYLEGMRY